jgi:hypothetical protein
MVCFIDDVGVTSSCRGVEVIEDEEDEGMGSFEVLVRASSWLGTLEEVGGSERESRCENTSRE